MMVWSLLWFLRIAALHWEHGDQLLDARYFPLRESRTLLFDVSESAPAGLRLYLGFGLGASRGI